jgi:hypothetical protein
VAECTVAATDNLGAALGHFPTVVTSGKDAVRIMRLLLYLAQL